MIVDLQERKVFTINPLQEPVSPEQVLAGKWIAKLFSIITYYIDSDINNKEGKTLYLGNADMISDAK